jgi:predicted dienelactone hydrolase
MQDSKCKRRQTALACVLGLVSTGLWFTPSDVHAQGSERFKVGSVTKRFVPSGQYNWRGATIPGLVTNIWYPVADSTAETPHSIGPSDSPWFRLGQWADDAQPLDRRFPLIVLSHGTGGSASIIAWIATALASRGYVVAGVNHPGNTSLGEYTAEGFLLWWERARDVTTVITSILRDPQFGPRVDPMRIGAAGFSLGGYTVIAIAGGRIDPAKFGVFCRAHSADICADPPEFPGLLSRWHELQKTDTSFKRAARQARESYRDPRVRAVFAIAPALGPAFITSGLRRIEIPTAIVAGDKDHFVDIHNNARLLAANIPRAVLTTLPNADHYTFLATCTEVGIAKRPDLCRESPEVDRDAIHAITAARAIQFFAEKLR